MSHDDRKKRRQERKKQLRINSQLKKKLFKDMFMAPCCYCKLVFMMDDLTIEHITPRCLGSSNEPHNIALACAPCNQAKGREAYFHKKQLMKEKYEEYTSKHC